jgi:hypothetical protein
MEAKKLTNNSHLISDSYGNKLGLTFNMGKTILFTYDLNRYETMDDIAKHLNEKLVYTELPSNEESAKELFGYPIKHDQYFNESQTDNLVIYTTRQESDVYYIAGWWVIGTESIHRATLSPKLKTVTEESVGPFTNKFDCQAEVTRLNKKKLSE